MEQMPAAPHGKRLDPTKAADLKVLIETGLIWNPAIPVEYKDLAIDALVDMAVPYNERIPEDVLAEVNNLRNMEGRAPIGPGEGEGEPSA